MAEYPNNCGANDDMKVDGKVGIGTASPSASLDIAAAAAGTRGIRIGTNNSYEIEFTGGDGANIYSGSSHLVFLAGTGKEIHFGTNGTNSQMILQNGGDMKVTGNGKGIILTSPNGQVKRRLYLKDDGNIGLEHP